LFKDQDISEIIKIKSDGQNSINNTRNNESVLVSPTTRLESFINDASFISETPDFTTIQGYYKKKHSHEILNTADLIHKLRKTGVL